MAGDQKTTIVDADDQIPQRLVRFHILF
jgi:hypothetical protein